MSVRMLILVGGLLLGCHPIRIGRHIKGFQICEPVVGHVIKRTCGDPIKWMTWAKTGRCAVYPNHLAGTAPYVALCTVSNSKKIIKIFELQTLPPPEGPKPPPPLPPPPPPPPPPSAYDPCDKNDDCGPDMECAGQEVGLRFCTPKCKADTDCQRGACQLNLSKSGDPDHCVLTCKKDQIGKTGCMPGGVCAGIGKDIDLGFCVHPDSVQK